MFESGYVTAKMIQDKLDISKQASLRWIDQMSLHMPVVEIGLEYTGGRGRPGMKYGLLK